MYSLDCQDIYYNCSSSINANETMSDIPAAKKECMEFSKTIGLGVLNTFRSGNQRDVITL